MKVYRTDEIRNVVLLGHGGSGKTSLAEAMLYVSGAVSRMGKISESNTTSDFDKEEQKRGFSISTSLIPIEWEKAKINILDTPGYFDFVGEVEEAVSATDAAVIVVSGKAGVQVGTEKAWELCEYSECIADDIKQWSVYGQHQRDFSESDLEWEKSFFLTKKRDSSIIIHRLREREESL